jgi:dTDP-4-amino-4,6-dideoxygalactose transaminase
MVPFNRPHLTGRELEYIAEAANASQLAGNGMFTRRCHEWLQHALGSPRVLLTHSCTAALEMSALLLDIEPGDEVIMPSFTFVSTANAFVLRGARPVFVDIRADTLNIDERLIEAAITPRTRAVIAVHYAGVACDMDAIADIARRHRLAVVEDAAQGLLSRYKGRALGSIGRFGAISFHETKNVISGEGGALIINDSNDAERAEVLWEKGTNRARFFRGEVDKYTWVDVGSSYLPGELTAAFLWAQLESARAICDERVMLWRRYQEASVTLEEFGAQTPAVPAGCEHNGHVFYVILPPAVDQQDVIVELGRLGVHAVFHYVPLHSSPAGRRFGRVVGSMKVTDDISTRLIRLPLWPTMETSVPGMVIERLTDVLATLCNRHASAPERTRSGR